MTFSQWADIARACLPLAIASGLVLAVVVGTKRAKRKPENRKLASSLARAGSIRRAK